MKTVANEFVLYKHHVQESNDEPTNLFVEWLVKAIEQHKAFTIRSHRAYDSVIVLAISEGNYLLFKQHELIYPSDLAENVDINTEHTIPVHQAVSATEIYYFVANAFYPDIVAGAQVEDFAI